MRCMSSHASSSTTCARLRSVLLVQDQALLREGRRRLNLEEAAEASEEEDEPDNADQKPCHDVGGDPKLLPHCLLQLVRTLACREHDEERQAQDLLTEHSWAL